MTDQGSKAFDVKARIEALTGVSRDGRPPVGLKGQMQRSADHASIEIIKAGATPPSAMSAAPVAPARGPQRLVANVLLHKGGLQSADGAHWEAMDPLSLMCRKAYERHADKGGDDAEFVAPFTPGQIAVGQEYRSLVEWRQGSAMKCASLEAGRGGGQGGLFIDIYIDQGNWLAELHRRIGAGSGLSVRRVRPSARGAGARAIPDRYLVDAVLVRDEKLSEVLGAYDWAVDGKNREALRKALAAALDRMMGYR